MHCFGLFLVSALPLGYCGQEVVRHRVTRAPAHCRRLRGAVPDHDRHVAFRKPDSPPEFARRQFLP